jgi:hypothetical protein
LATRSSKAYWEPVGQATHAVGHGRPKSGETELGDKRQCSGAWDDPRPPILAEDRRADGSSLRTLQVLVLLERNQVTGEPEHIHVASGDGWAIFWLRPVSLRKHRGYTPREIERIRRIIVANEEQLLRHWHEFFDQAT